MHNIDTLANNGTDPLIFNPPWIRLEANARIVMSDLDGNHTIGRYSCLNRSRVGRYSGFGSFSYLVDTEVGRYSTIGSRVSIGGFNHPTDWLSVHEFQYRDTSAMYGVNVFCDRKNSHREHTLDTKIGNDVWIGDNVVILRGVTVSTGVIVGAGSVVTKNVEPYMIVAGNPARLIRPRFDSIVANKLLESEWWVLEMEELQGLNYSKVEGILNVLNVTRRK
jgi:acetyltransferase-like isoleucine patch superfamily enzyme